MEKWIRYKKEYIGKIFNLITGEVQLDNGSITHREMIEHNGGVAIVPVINDNVILIRQFRISIDQEIVELPAGRIEIDESPEVTAKRELEEEIGYTSNKLVLATSYYSSVGFTNEKMYIYLAFDLHKTPSLSDWDEKIKTLEIPLDEIETKLSNNEFEDSKTLIGLRELLSFKKNA